MPQERETWEIGRGFTYSAQLGMEEGLRACGVDTMTFTTLCKSRLRGLAAGRRFDQVWVHVYPESFDPEFWNFVAEAAPVRLGFVPESLGYTAAELAQVPWFANIATHYRRVEQYLTHVATADEADSEAISDERKRRATWWVGAVPGRYISDAPPPRVKQAIFVGRLYDDRAELLEHPELRRVIRRSESPEAGTVYPFLYESLNANVQRYLRRPWLPAGRCVAEAYMQALRWTRRRAFGLWIRSLQQGAAVVNLPHFVKTYSGRVWEAMAAGRPVVSWAIPDRPKNQALFDDGREILLFRKDDPLELVEALRRVLSDDDLASRLVECARTRIRRFHTVERRVQQLLKWVENGDEPRYA